MKSLKKSQRGSGLVVVLSVIAIVLTLSAIGYTYYDRVVKKNETVQDNSNIVVDSTEKIESSLPDTLKDTKDIDEAMLALDKISETDSDSDLDVITAQLEDL